MRAKFSGPYGRHRIFEEKPKMGPVTGAGSFHGGRKPKFAANFPNSAHIFTPIFLVEVGGQEEAGLILQHGVDTHNKLTARLIPARKMMHYGFIGYGKESPVGAVGASNLAFVAQVSDPLVGASGAVTRLAGLSTLETARIHIRPSAKERSKQGDLGRGCGVLTYSCMLLIHHLSGQWEGAQ
ncbi:MAG: hypothetical protein V2A34_13985 [Lentisphaerota bacterium]